MTSHAQTLLRQLMELPAEEREEVLFAASDLPTPLQLAELERRYEAAKDKPGIPAEEVHAKAKEMLNRRRDAR